MEFLRTSPQNGSETVTNETENKKRNKEIPKKRFISLEKKILII